MSSSASRHAASMRRTEDHRLITGRGCYTDDVNPTGMDALHLLFLRSPVACGAIKRVEVATARAMPGVAAVLTIEDLDAMGVRDPQPSAFNAEDERGKVSLPQPALARAQVCFVGEPVAAVVARSVHEGLDALEQIELEIDEAEAVADLRAARAPNAPQPWSSRAPGNVLGTRTRGDRAATEAALASATHRVEIDVVNNRVSPVTLEPRGCVVVPMGGEPPSLAIQMGTQGVHAMMYSLASVLPLAPEQIRVMTDDVGGGFGMRLFLQGEVVVACAAALQLGQPVRWQATRSEGFLADLNGRDHRSRAVLGLDDDLRFVALHTETWSNVGAYTSTLGASVAWFGSSMLTGVYDIPQAFAETHVVVTNTSPVDAYRGAGRPEASYLIERLVDEAAAQLEVSPIELRLRNLIRSDQFPYATPLGQVYDSGDYERLLLAAWRRAGGDDFPARRAASAASGRLRGLGVSCYVEVCAGFGEDQPLLVFRDDGVLELRVGTQSTGQGHETVFTQMLVSRLGVRPEQVQVRQGDTALLPMGAGTGGSRTLAVGGSAVALTLDAMEAAGKRMAASLLEADASDISFADGQFTVVGTDIAVSLTEVVAASFDPHRRVEGVEEGLASSEVFSPSAGTFPNGCHVCEVEVDPETGEIAIVAYVIQDDMGRIGNALLLEGQIVGGAVQGLSQALIEQVVYEPESAQLLTGSFMDYGVLRAHQAPAMDVRFDCVPSPNNPLGVKGAGEAGTIGAPAALVNAVLDALRPVGVKALDMPLTPHRVWQALQQA